MKELPGRVGTWAIVGGVEVRAGDWVVGDSDGVVVVAGGRVDEVLAAGRAHAGKESRFFTELRGRRDDRGPPRARPDSDRRRVALSRVPRPFETPLIAPRSALRAVDLGRL
jgi:hypothetical protein